MQQIDQILTIILICVIALTAVTVISAIVLSKRKKPLSGVEKEDGKQHKFEDASSLVPIDDIRDGMIIDENGGRFTGVLICSGSDFISAPIDAKVSAQNAYMGFWHSLMTDISFRQSSESVNLNYHIDKLNAAYQNVQEERYNLTENMKTALEIYKEAIQNGEVIEKETEEGIAKTERRIRSLDWRLSHIEDEIRHASRMSTSAALDKRVKVYCFSWKPQAGVLSAQTGGKELYEQAISELDKLGRQMARQLSMTGAIARRATDDEIMDLFRHQMRPYSSDLFATKDIMSDTTWKDDVVTTDSFKKIKEQYRREVVERLTYGGV